MNKASSIFTHEFLMKMAAMVNTRPLIACPHCLNSVAFVECGNFVEHQETGIGEIKPQLAKIILAVQGAPNQALSI
jgi:hypothetical protein